MLRYKKRISKRRSVRKSKPTLAKRVVKGMNAVGRVARLARNVQFLSSIVNAEKKTHSGSMNFTTGQVNGNDPVPRIFDITPTMGQGTTGQTRIGNSYKLHTMCLKGQVFQQQNNHHQGKVKFIIFQNMGTPIPTASLNVADLFDLNPINGIYDINSSRAEDTFRNFRIVKTHFSKIMQDNYSGVQAWRDFVIPIRFKSHHVKFNDSNSNVVTSGQLILVVLADSGNVSSSTTSTVANIPVTGINSGFTVAGYIKSWYYDN